MQIFYRYPYKLSKKCLGCSRGVFRTHSKSFSRKTSIIDVRLGSTYTFGPKDLKNRYLQVLFLPCFFFITHKLSTFSIFSLLIQFLYRLCIIYVCKTSGDENKTLPWCSSSFAFDSKLSKKECRSLFAWKYFYDRNLITLEPITSS